MIDWLILVIGLIILVVSAIDFKLSAVPSILLTGLIFVVMALQPQNLFFGMLGLVIAFLLFEGGFISGIGDVKVMTAIAFMINSLLGIVLLIALTFFFGLAWKGIWILQYKRKLMPIPEEFPFLPVYFFVYLALYLVGGLNG